LVEDVAEYRQVDIAFSYPATMNVSENDGDISSLLLDANVTTQFRGVGVSSPGEGALVYVRTNPYGKPGDEVALGTAFSRKRCGPVKTLLGATEVGPNAHDFPTPNGNGYYVRRFARRNLANNMECLQATIYTPPPGDEFVRRANSRKPHMADRYAVILYVHVSPLPTQNWMTETRIGGNDEAAYLRSLHTLNTIVDSFRFTR
jgi:hypothetical protein